MSTEPNTEKRTDENAAEPYALLREAVERVSDMHRPAPPLDGNCPCVECGNPYPCRTQIELCSALADCDDLVDGGVL